METKEVDAICLRSVDYKDNDKILSLYGAGFGKISVIAKGCKKPKAKLKFASSPLCFGHYYLNKKGNLYTLLGCDLYDSFFDIAMDPEKYYAATVVLEILDKMGLEDDYNNNFFIICLECIKELAYKTDDAKTCLFSYLKKILESLGYECKSITFMEYYNYFLHIHGVKINSLKEITKL